jgi:predicted SnoaL-like aldol condensation-catalyzing enzyme
MRHQEIQALLFNQTEKNEKGKLLITLVAMGIVLQSCTGNGANTKLQANVDSLTSAIQTLSDNQKQLEANKKLVADFYQELFGDKNVDAIDKYIGDTYIQHNPALPDGKDALKQGATQWFKGAPKEKIDIQHLGADGNFVYIHTKVKMGDKTNSVIDIFRLENGKIAEHWDVIQEVPKISANPHPMF